METPRNRLNRLILVSALAFASAVAHAATYYVSTTGNDKNSGTSSTAPWKTIAKVNASSFSAGDQVLFKAGQSFSGTLELTTNTSGTATAPVVISTYGSGRATISAGSGSGIVIYNVGGVSLSNLKVVGGWNAYTQSGNTGGGIYFYTDLTGGQRLPSIWISSCEVSGFKTGGIIFGSYPSDGSQSGVAGVSVTYASTHDNGDNGLSSWGPSASAGSTAYAFTQVYIGWVTCYNNQGVANKGSHSGDGIVVGDVSGGTIEHCVAYSNGAKNNYQSSGPAGIWAWDSNAVTIQYCESHHETTGAGTVDGDGFDLDGGTTNCVMQYNYAHDNRGAGLLVYEYGDTRANNSGNVVRFNVSQNDSSNPSYASILLGGNCTNDRIYNNTVYNAAHRAVVVAGGTGNWFINNIFFTNGSGNDTAYITTTACWFLNNDYWPGRYAQRISYMGKVYSSLAAFQATGQETWNGTPYGFAVSPSLSAPGSGGNVNSGTPSSMTCYELDSGSPLLGAGIDLSAWGIDMGGSDFYLRTVPPVNIGAY